MLVITNKEAFEDKCKDIILSRYKPVINKARDEGYMEVHKTVPDTTGIMRSHLAKNTKAPRQGAIYVKGIRFDGLDSGRKDALSKMQTGFNGWVRTDTPAMQAWLDEINNPMLASLPAIQVGKGAYSKFYGGNKNPMQFGKKTMKEVIEKDLKIQFK